LVQGKEEPKGRTPSVINKESYRSPEDQWEKGKIQEGLAVSHPREKVEE